MPQSLTQEQDCDNVISAGSTAGLPLGTECQAACTGNPNQQEACGNAGVLGVALARMSIYEYIVSVFRHVCVPSYYVHVISFVHRGAATTYRSGKLVTGGR